MGPDRGVTEHLGRLEDVGGHDAAELVAGEQYFAVLDHGGVVVDVDHPGRRVDPPGDLVGVLRCGQP